MEQNDIWPTDGRRVVSDSWFPSVIFAKEFFSAKLLFSFLISVSSVDEETLYFSMLREAPRRCY